MVQAVTTSSGSNDFREQAFAVIQRNIASAEKALKGTKPSGLIDRAHAVGVVAGMKAIEDALKMSETDT